MNLNQQPYKQSELYIKVMAYLLHNGSTTYHVTQDESRSESNQCAFIKNALHMVFSNVFFSFTRFINKTGFTA